MAGRLDAGQIHVWRLRYDRNTARQPFRALLAHYLGVPAERVHFLEGTHGRPGLSDPDSNLHFNWSHSGGLACLAVARDLPVLGVDLESIRPRARALELSRRFFHAREAAWLAGLPLAQVERGFLRLWTGKEAVLKGLGEGLRFGLDRIPLECVADTPRPAGFDPAAGPDSAWWLQQYEDASSLICVAWRNSQRQVIWLEP